MTKDRVLEALWKNRGQFVSGGQLARNLSLSRTAVWKAVEQLRQEGYAIDSVSNRGHCLRTEDSMLSGVGIRESLQHRELQIRVFPSISSTNTVLKQMAEGGAPEGLVLAADEQTAGRGRLGRSFYSPAQTGLYMSLLLRPELSASEATRLTACAAVAVAESIEELTGLQPQIKWVNDVLVNGKKVCGILTEGAIDCETGRLHYAVVGIGINISVPEGGFPKELEQTAGTLIAERRTGGLRCRLAAAVLDRLMDAYEHLSDPRFYEAYKKRCFLLGQPIFILASDGAARPATVLDLAPDFSLIVREADGTVGSLNTGEVSVRPQ